MIVVSRISILSFCNCSRGRPTCLESQSGYLRLAAQASLQHGLATPCNPIIWNKQVCTRRARFDANVSDALTMFDQRAMDLIRAFLNNFTWSIVFNPTIRATWSTFGRVAFAVLCGSRMEALCVLSDGHVFCGDDLTVGILCRDEKLVEPMWTACAKMLVSVRFCASGIRHAITLLGDITQRGL